MTLCYAMLITPSNLTGHKKSIFFLNDRSLNEMDTNNLREFANFIGFSMGAYINGSIITQGGSVITNSANESNGFAVPFLYDEYSYYTVVVFAYLCYQAKLTTSAKIQPNINRIAARFKLSKTKVKEALAEMLVRNLIHIETQNDVKTYSITGLMDYYKNE
ncbi:hypothetical protein POF51_25825 [Brevibacillus sp. AG]|uniref:hypothetical protein n=1 Tax=Brevibacillus sp. AG TaxID=3020891 RepID=UPI0023315927|nr:hypothetical protein [Brevibacillus sp. AG]MDC0764142.1 hypothetical protein [Brevibacillus sp. AG]